MTLVDRPPINLGYTQEHTVPFGDKTLCVLIKRNATVVPGIIKDPKNYTSFKGGESNYHKISEEQKDEVLTAIADYFNERIQDNKLALEAIAKNISFW